MIHPPVEPHLTKESHHIKVQVGGGIHSKRKTTSQYAGRQVQQLTDPSLNMPITKAAGEWDKEVYCYALYNFSGELPCDLQFKKGQRIAIITRTSTQDDWWEGTVNGKTGIFPANYVSL